MRVSRASLAVGLAMVLAAAPAALCQQVAPHIGYVYPAGGRQGATFQVTVGGQFLDGVASAHVTGTGVEAKLIEYVKPINVQQANLLRDKLQELMEKRAAALGGGMMGFRGAGFGAKRAAAAATRPALKAPTTKPTWTAEDDKAVAEIRKKLSTFVRRPSSPAIAESATLQITIAADAPSEQRELRLSTPLGLTNPLVFRVGQLPEFSQNTVKNTGEPKSSVGRREMSVTLPATINGQILPGGVDRYVFQAKKGQRLVVAVAARELIPYIADAVPGWFQATVGLYDAKGNELAYADHHQFHPDPVIYCQIPSDGEYAIEIKDSIYRGREDFVYRIDIGELPFITGIFPLGGPAGAQTTIDLMGWNLPANQLLMDAKDKYVGIYPISVRNAVFASNRVPFEVDNLPECTEREPNDTPATAQSVQLPILINGRIGQPGDVDVYRFEGHSGDDVVAEVYARRLDSPLDSVLKLTDANGKQLAFNDDREDKGSGLYTHHADSYLTATLPETGTYYVHIADTQHQGGSEYAYRLRISAPRPDFALRVVPSGIDVRAGATVPVSVYALRKDGFTGEIALSLKNAPAGFSLAGAVIPARQDKVRLTLTVPAFFANKTLDLHVEGRATIRGRQIVHEAIPAEDMMQAFAYRHLVPAQQLTVAISGRVFARAGGQVSILSSLPVKIPAGGTARLEVGLPMNNFFGRMKLELNDPPEGLSIRNTSPSRGGTEIVLKAEPNKIKPGIKGNLIIDAYPDRPAAGAKGGAQVNRRRPPAVTLPAIPFEITAR